MRQGITREAIQGLRKERLAAEAQGAKPPVPSFEDRSPTFMPGDRVTSRSFNVHAVVEFSEFDEKGTEWVMVRRFSPHPPETERREHHVSALQHFAGGLIHGEWKGPQS